MYEKIHYKKKKKFNLPKSKPLALSLLSESDLSCLPWLIPYNPPKAVANLTQPQCGTLVLFPWLQPWPHPRLEVNLSFSFHLSTHPQGPLYETFRDRSSWTEKKTTVCIVDPVRYGGQAPLTSVPPVKSRCFQRGKCTPPLSSGWNIWKCGQGEADKGAWCFLAPWWIAISGELGNHTDSSDFMEMGRNRKCSYRKLSSFKDPHGQECG